MTDLLFRRRIGWLLYGSLVVWLCLALLWARGFFLPAGENRTETVSFSDGTLWTLSVSQDRFSATRDGVAPWESDPGWHVQDFLTGDIDRDGDTELLLLVWRRGNYGPSKPIWVRHNDTRWSQHIFIYNRQGDSFAPQWMSSQLRPQVARWSLQGTDELFILTPDGAETLWRWGQWGLERTDVP